MRPIWLLFRIVIFARSLHKLWRVLNLCTRKYKFKCVVLVVVSTSYWLWLVRRTSFRHYYMRMGEPQGGDTPAKPRAQALGYMLSYIYWAPSGAALPAQVLGGSGGGVKNKGGCIIVWHSPLVVMRVSLRCGPRVGNCLSQWDCHQRRCAVYMFHSVDFLPRASTSKLLFLLHCTQSLCG